MSQGNYGRGPYEPPQVSEEPPVLMAQVIDGDSDATGGLIPYKNLPALTAYYLSVFSLIPFLGVLLGIPAVVLGVVGYRAYRKQPSIRGSIHAWIGILLGGATTLLWVGLVIVTIAYSSSW